MKIDLGMKNSMGSMAMPLAPEMPEKSYPRLHIDCGDVLLDNLPDVGIMEIKFKVVSRSCNENNGKKSCCVTLEVQQILDVETGPKDTDDTASALDRLAELESAKEDSDEPGEE